MEIKELIDLNRTSLFKQLDAIKVHIGHHYRCDDIIKELSSSVTSDKRLINDYEDDETVILTIRVKGMTRKCRAFTKKGLIRYIHEGKVVDYENACLWVGTKPKNKLMEKVEKLLVDGKFAKSKILKFLFEKRKTTSALDNYVTPAELLTWLEPYKEDIDQERYECINAISGINPNLS